MHRHFEDELARINRALLGMAAKVETQVIKAVGALELGDDVLIEEVRASEVEIDALENEIEERCIRQIALQAPVAHDLRMLIGIIRISTDLERMADHAINITHAAARIPSLPPLERPLDLHQMAVIATEMLKDAIAAYTNQDVKKARAVIARDDEMDRLRDELLHEIREEMMRSSQSVPRALELFLATRNLERVSDLATNIAEETVYIEEARVLRHQEHKKP
jgi:phosphate transport system protein